MATRKQIENLLKNVNVTISKEAVGYVYNEPANFKEARTLEEYLYS